ncbi:OLC1v1011419C1 [Oldenlandia corymbosa var. corymbosa]|uniref:OLC1v1011419C1 n=1 Tax=Oldenlandia corymbosa var. corymbosa TaxID=529605 RepID=A0AAV1DVA3_OLDCO|nr:OLC1v1011419C1 [Oldenlandia corymbosa var. corymbosa]
MWGRRRFLSMPLVIGAVVIGVVSGKAIFGPPLDEYWKKKQQEEAAATAAAKENEQASQS